MSRSSMQLYPDCHTSLVICRFVVLCPLSSLQCLIQQVAFVGALMLEPPGEDNIGKNEMAWSDYGEKGMVEDCLSYGRPWLDGKYDFEDAFSMDAVR